MAPQLDEKTSVSGQIRPEEVARLKAEGVTMIINNRPDHEDEGQPTSAEIEAAAKAAGIAYRHVPILRMGPADVEAMHEAMDAAGDGKVHAFCRSGNRSALCWAVARSEHGASEEQLRHAVEGAGFNLGPVAHLLRS
ncbi:TIGR01244 family sulfur transferase [Sphingomonas sp. ASV193]|uniref:TIGR01244 family sulfur transferase n=1 Tax=Sphingomonas sp. ASV193 TaxID=3144405 RepID=UPI0032E8B0C5